MRKPLIIAGAVIGLVILVACGGNPSPGPTRTTVPTASPSPSATDSGRPTKPTANPTTTAPTIHPSPTGPVSAEQRNATRAAQSYLDMQAFSRKGLIRQLSSDSGDGFPASVATAAVDSLHVDWNAQAVKAAKGYLSMQAFSKKGLTEQLESSYGDAFTHDQAVYGVAHSGL